MTRDGAVEVNETQQTAERISSREADSNFSQPDTATAERVMEHLDAAHTRKASKKAVKKAQEATGFLHPVLFVSDCLYPAFPASAVILFLSGSGNGFSCGKNILLLPVPAAISPQLLSVP